MGASGKIMHGKTEYQFRNLDEKIDQEKLQGDLSILYSGGLDSTFIALYMGKRVTGKIHLLTYVFKYLTLFHDWSEKHVKELNGILGAEKLNHKIFFVTDIFKKITTDALLGNLMAYKNHFIFCLGCHLGMVTRSVIYNLENKVSKLLMCSSVGGQYAVASMPVTIEEDMEFLKEYRMEYITPILDLNIIKPEEKDYLRKHGLNIGFEFRRGTHGVEPVCIPGLQHLGDVLFDLHTKYDPLMVRKFIKDKKPVMRKYIEENFINKQIPPESVGNNPRF